MLGKNVSGIMLTLILLMRMSMFAFIISEASSQPVSILYVDPSIVRVSVDTDFTVDVSVADVVDLYAFGFCLDYNTTILHVSAVLIQLPFEGPIIEINETEGYLRVTASLPPESPKLSGSFGLTSITFTAASPGNSTLRLYDSVLIGAEIKPMLHTRIDGSAKVYSSKLLLETDKRIYKLGENVTIILTNISNQTIEVGGYPAWQIFTFPEEEPIYPNVFAWILLAWSLDPGENDTFTWNQYNEFNHSFCGPGTYVVRDLQGWGLSAYFKIVSAEIIVPNDYSTIQEAINAANPGDTVYVRSGKYHEHVVVNKQLQIAGENKSTTIIDGNGTGTVISIQTQKITLISLTVQNGKFGIFIQGTDNNNLIDNMVSDNMHGIELTSSSHNRLINNTVTDNLDGFEIAYANNNTFVNNIASHNRRDGILMHCSENNVLYSNKFSNNVYGIRVSDSSNNTFYHNNFINNSNHVILDEDSLNNIWAYSCEGNFWSSYNGSDLNGDGIGDTYLPWEGVDYYPLMNPYWSPCDINHDLKVDIRDIATAALAYGSFPNHPKWNPHADVTGPISLEPDDIVDIRDVALIAKNYGEIYP